MANGNNKTNFATKLFALESGSIKKQKVFFDSYQILYRLFPSALSGSEKDRKTDERQKRQKRQKDEKTKEK